VNESEEGLASIDLIFQVSVLSFFGEIILISFAKDGQEQYPESSLVNLWEGYYAQTYHGSITLAMKHLKVNAHDSEHIGNRF